MDGWFIPLGERGKEKPDRLYSLQAAEKALQLVNMNPAYISALRLVPLS